MKDSFPTAGSFTPSERSMTAIDPESGVRLFFRDFQTMSAYGRVIDPRWLCELSDDER